MHDCETNCQQNKESQTNDDQNFFKSHKIIFKSPELIIIVNSFLYVLVQTYEDCV